MRLFPANLLTGADSHPVWGRNLSTLFFPWSLESFARRFAVSIKSSMISPEVILPSHSEKRCQNLLRNLARHDSRLKQSRLIDGIFFNLQEINNYQ
ncbi:MAG: hypothetical protein ABL925_03115 [Methylococcales bacterium]